MPPYLPCPCSCCGDWTPWSRELKIGVAASLPGLPPLSPVKTWMHSIPTLPWANPYTIANDYDGWLCTFTLPPGITSVAITAGYVFSNGHKCSAHATIPTP